jgi:hypothetical protein
MDIYTHWETNLKPKSIALLQVLHQRFKGNVIEIQAELDKLPELRKTVRKDCKSRLVLGLWLLKIWLFERKLKKTLASLKRTIKVLEENEILNIKVTDNGTMGSASANSE